MRIPPLEYPRVQTYAIPYITEFFYPLSIILIVLLAALNVAIAGNDVVSELKDNPNNTDSKWWAPRWIPESISLPTVPGPCQPLTIAQRATSIRTNSTLPIFSYTLLNGLGKYQNGTPRWYDSIEYNAQPLERCEVQNITALIDFQNRGHVLTSQVICSIASTNEQLPPTLKFSTTFSRMANTDLGSDDIIDYISSYVVPRTSDIRDAEGILLVEGSSPLNMLGVLDAFGSEILKALWARKWTWKIARNESWPDQAVVTWTSQPDCQGPNAERWCRIGVPEMGGIGRWYTNTRGSQDFDSVYLQPMNTTLLNYFVAMRDAIHLDMGNVNPSTNIFLNNTAFQQRIAHDPFMNQTAPLVIGLDRPDGRRPFDSTQFWSTCTWGWGCLNGTWTDALLRQDPAQNISRGLPLSLFDGPVYSTVIDVKYVCPVFKPKTIGSLLVSVFIGTFSMYTALYGVFAFFAPQADEWYRKKHGLHRFSPDEDNLGNYAPLAGKYPYQTPPGSSNTHKTVFDAAELYDHDIPRYDKDSHQSDQTAGYPKSPLPHGAYLPVPNPHSSQLQLPLLSSSSITSRRGRSFRFANTSSDPERDALLRESIELSEPAVPPASANIGRSTTPDGAAPGTAAI
ncbi:hypothetical protein FRC07_005699 [Ceratobasidium sp. 392]|nr:hypothetical protein FRC07_005699 [Ceratobasidium sp. 392]